MVKAADMLAPRVCTIRTVPEEVTMNAPARTIDLVFQEPAVLRMRYGRQVGITAQIALMIAFVWVRPFSGHQGAPVALLLEGLILTGLALTIVRSVRRV